jgi:hypothetical protein
VKDKKMKLIEHDREVDFLLRIEELYKQLLSLVQLFALKNNKKVKHEMVRKFDNLLQLLHWYVSYKNKVEWELKVNEIPNTFTFKEKVTLLCTFEVIVQILMTSKKSLTDTHFNQFSHSRSFEGKPLELRVIQRLQLIQLIMEQGILSKVMELKVSSSHQNLL